jgi:hypothetical protein
VTKEKISEYDASADGNTDVNGVNIAEGCAPSGINNAIREVMGALKRFETGADGDSITVGGNLVVSGSTTANTIGATVVNASGNATVGGTLVVTGATTFSGNVVVSGTTTANTFSTDLITEKTSAAGVTVDGVLLKDTTVTANTIKASGTASSQGEVQLFEDTDNGTNYVGFRAPASITADTVWTLPDADGTADQVLKTNGSGVLAFATAGGGGGVNVEVFTANGTFTIPSGVTKLKVTVVGGGGAGGAATGVDAGGGGGGGGGVAIKWLTDVTPGNTLAVTRGAAAGTSSVASGTETISTISATGGANAPTAAGDNERGPGGAGGSGSGGTINITGGAGGGAAVFGAGAIGGGGGSPFCLGGEAVTGVFGRGGIGAPGTFGGMGGTGTQNTTGGAATGNGNGGGGGGTTTNADFNGGAGSVGIIIFEW